MKLASIAGAAGLIVTLAVAAILPIAQLAAQENETFTKEHIQAAGKVVAAARAAEGFDEILPIVAEETRALFIRSNPHITQLIETVVDEIAIEMAADRPKLDRTINEVWARRFTQQELEEIYQFYNTPVGKKLSEKSPELIALTIGAAKQWEKTIATDMVTKARAEIEKHSAAENNTEGENKQ